MTISEHRSILRWTLFAGASLLGISILGHLETIGDLRRVCERAEVIGVLDRDFKMQGLCSRE